MPIEIQEPDYDLSFLLQPIEPSEEGLRQVRRQAGRRRAARRTTAIAAALLFFFGVAVLLTTGDGSDNDETRVAAPSPLEVVRGVPEAMKTVGAASVKASASHPDGGAEKFTATYDFGRSTGLLRLDDDGLEPSEVRILDGILYLPIPTESPDDPPIWYSLDPAEVGRIKPGARESIGSVSLMNPGVAVQLLGAAAEVEDVGAEPVGETSTTHYRALIDIDGLKGLSRLAGEILVDKGGRHVDVWVDTSGRAVRMAVETARDNPVKLDYLISDFGQSVKVSKPTEQIISAVDAGYGETRTVTGGASATVSGSLSSSPDHQGNCTSTYKSNGTTTVETKPC